MRPCTRVGLDVSWRCQWRCRHCFYLRNPNFHKGYDVPVDEVLAKARQAADGGLDHAVLVGYGEPSLCNFVYDILIRCHEMGLATSMITNGATGLWRFKNYFGLGLDHLHISTHGAGETLNRIVGNEHAWERQQELKDWLATEGLPYRVNVALQQENYQKLTPLIDNEVEHSVFHFVFLGFLPHYEWGQNADWVRGLAVHPAELRPCIEEAAGSLAAQGTYFTIRYHPLCHLSPEWWPYVVNARYVFFDPWEWNYELQVNDVPALWRAALRCGGGVACHAPCDQCLAFRHCGGWNRVMAAAFGGADLTPIREVPDQYKGVWDRDGGLHDLNPVNGLTGTIRPMVS